MKSKCRKMLLFLISLLGLQQAIALGNAHVDALHRQSNMVLRQDIDPSALFYMESPLALNAEKVVRNRIRMKN